jgi:ABC-type bacteriocin/lantibiotic exporter with double-glycine peptidase domain
MKFSKHLESFYDLCASVDKVGTIFKMPLEPQTGIDIEPKEEGLSLEIRNIAYETASGVRILRNISFSLAPGERAVLRGPNGSGKSTIIDMLYGLRVPVEGSVYINGVDIRDLSLNSLRSQVALIRSVEPLPDTILNNITLGRSDVPYERVRAVLEEVGLLSEIESLPDHLQSQIDEQGKPLSSAQLQRLMIARTLAQEPRLLLIDSPLETLDEKWRELIYSAIVSQRRPCTVLWATDDLRIQEICNKSIMISMEDHGTP